MPVTTFFNLYFRVLSKIISIMASSLNWILLMFILYSLPSYLSDILIYISCKEISIYISCKCFFIKRLIVERCLIHFPHADTEAPTVDCPSNSSVSMDLGLSTANVTWSPLPTATDNVDNIDNNTIVCTDCLGNVVMSGDFYTEGLTTVTCRVSDTALNEGSCEFNITVTGKNLCKCLHFFICISGYCLK